MLAAWLAALTLGGWLQIDAGASEGSRCLQVARIEAAVARMLERAPFAPADGVRVRVQLVRAGQQLSARAELLDGQGAVVGAREIAGRVGRCPDLAQALALSLALAIRESPSEAAPETAAEDSIGAAPDPDAPIAPAFYADQAPAVSTAALSPPATGWDAWVGGAGMVGALPGGGVGLATGGQVRRGRLALASEARFDWGLPVRREGASIQSLRLAGAVMPCIQTAPVALCGGLRGGLLWAESTRATGSPMLEALARLRVFLGSTRVSLFAEPGLGLVRTRLSIDGRPVWTTPRFSAAAGVLMSTR